MGILLFLLVLYSAIGIVLYLLLKHQEDKLKALGLLVPDFSAYDGAAGCGIYSGFWIFTAPVTVVHYYCIKPLIKFIKDL